MTKIVTRTLHNPFTQISLSSLLTPKKVNVKGDLILEIFNLAAQQGKCNKKLFFVLLSVYDEENLRLIKSACVDKVRQGFSVEKYIKWLRKTK